MLKTLIRKKAKPLFSVLAIKHFFTVFFILLSFLSPLGKHHIIFFQDYTFCNASSTPYNANNLAIEPIKWVKSSEVAQSCRTLCDPMDWSLSGSSIHGILQARILEWVAVSFSRGYSWPRDRTQLSHIAGTHFNLWATREAHWTYSSLQFLKFCLSTYTSNLWLNIIYSFLGF